MSQPNQPYLITRSAEIAITETKTDAIALGGLQLVGIAFPTFTGTAVSFEVCDTVDGTFLPLHSTISGTVLSYTVASSRYVAIDPVAFLGAKFIKIVSGSSEAAARTLVISLKG